jgi:hypothetical protein
MTRAPKCTAQPADATVVAQLHLTGMKASPQADAERLVASCSASAQSIARLGLSKVASVPSPEDSTNRPRWSEVC